MSTRIHRRAARLLLGAHRFVVMELVVYPTARPTERRVLAPALEPHEVPVEDRRTTPDTVALFEFLTRAGV
jgi:hypothetical protein